MKQEEINPTTPILKLSEDGKMSNTFPDHTSHPAVKGWAELPELRHHLDRWFRPPRFPLHRSYQLVLTGQLQLENTEMLSTRFKSQPSCSAPPCALVLPPPTIRVNKAPVSLWAGRCSHNRLCSILLSNRLHLFQWLKTQGFLCWRSQAYS